MCHAVNHGRLILAFCLFLTTFGWLLLPTHMQGPSVLWPSVLAVTLAFVMRNIYLALFLGSFAGTILLARGNVFMAFLNLFSEHLIPALSDGTWNISVLIFTLLIGGLAALLNSNGGMLALAEWFLGPAESKRRALLGAYGMGLLLFIDGLASSMLVGKAMQSTVDRAGVSREKLAFVVDSTSAPIAGLALISTWIAYEMSVIREGFMNIGNSVLAESVSSYQMLIFSLPYRHYNYFMLMIVFLIIWLGRDFGPMLKAERATKQKDAVSSATVSKSRFRSLLAVIPLALLVISIFTGLYVDGGGLQKTWSWDNTIAAFGEANAAFVLVWATAGTVVVTLFLSMKFRSSNQQETSVDVFFGGMKDMFLPALILVFAWVLNSVIKEMGTAQYLVQFLGDKLSPALLPSCVFLLAAVISFSTGTSWGTMAIVTPLVIPIAVELTGWSAQTTGNEILYATIGAVLAGAVFGDHCSPISDTTIVSSFSSGCDHMDHVRTQLPYALLGAAVAIVLGYGLTAWVHPIWSLSCGLLVCWAIIRFVGCKSTI